MSEKIDAAVRFLREFQNYAPIQTAFWLKDTEEGVWFLYVASPRITDDNFHLAYSEVGRISEASA